MPAEDASPMPAEDDFLPAYRAESESRRERERGIAELAAEQHGVVSRNQLYELGFSRSAIGRRVAEGHLHLVHRGVYAVGHRRISGLGHWMAAVLACGSGALLSHRSAAALWDLRRSESRLVDVIVGAGGRRQRRGIRLHRTDKLHADDMTVHRGIPVASVALVLLGLAEMLRPTDVERAMEAAERLRLLDMRKVSELVARRRGCRAVAVLNQLVLHASEPSDAHGRLERLFADRCRQWRLPRPVLNTIVRGYEVDVLWKDRGLIVELDSWQHHGNRWAFERDRERDQKLHLAGHAVLRITWRQLVDQPEAIRGMLVRALGLRI